MNIQPYLFFNGQLDDAIAFYKDKLGAEVQMLLRYKDSPEPLPPGVIAPNWDDKIMHSCLKIGETTFFASDGCGTLAPGFNGFGLSIAVKDEAEADRVYAALADGGEVRMPLGKTFFAPRFGMVVDRFGVLWMIIVPQ
jgi:PhnB protein